MINKKALFTKNVNFSLQQQFVSKYTTTTLVKTSYGDEHILFFKKERAQLLDLYLQNFINNNQNYCLSNYLSENETVLNCVDCSKSEEIINEESIKLTKPKPQAKIRLVDTFSDKRKLKSKNNTKILNLKILSSMLNFAFQANKNNHRSYASIGALYPISLYLYVINVEGLTPGFYQYQPFHQSLKPISLEVVSVNKLADFSQKNNNLDSFILFYVYNSYKNRFKFANQSLLLASFEIGMMMQSLHLLSYEFDFTISHSTLFYPEIILKKLKIADYYSQHLLNVTMVGLYNNE